MPIPLYADERAKRFFYYGYTGKSGDYFWNTSAEGLEPTLTYPNGTCGYCGNRALSIQAGLRHRNRLDSERDYDVTGYTCCCKEAMDEVEHRTLVKQMKERHEDELAALNATAPAPSEAVFQKYAEGVLQNSMKSAMNSFKHIKSPGDLKKLAERLKSV